MTLVESDLAEPVKFGTDHKVATPEADLAEAVARSTLVHHPLPQDDPRRRRPLLHCARWSPEWDPKVRLREGIARAVAYFDAIQSDCTA